MTQHSHSHPAGFKGFFYEIFVPHSHDAADSIDDAMEAHSEGIRALKISLVLMLGTTVVQAVIVTFSGSVALLADTIHNLSDALTAVPLWIAFVLSRRVATRKYTYGFNRAEDLAGLFIVLMIALSSIVAAYEAIDRMINPRPMDNIGWVIAAGVIGFLGNEAVAVYRIRVGKKIGSAALVADGVHARTDGFTSPAVVVGGIGVVLGFPLADPIVGLLISAMIAVLLIGTVRSVGRRLMDGIEPELVDRAEHALQHPAEVESVESVRLRWVGHRLHGDALVRTSATSSAEADHPAEDAEAAVKKRMPNVDEMTVRVMANVR
ncbi:cation diffusion facilitator family transporter [Janibacter limosus]|uniref:Cation diffusion facilitator family transporter n=1 Tax=Janibacter limosus TaxID=53458 RepID=A0AC61U757_9MICO|nr:cation diffusion facilitator family transporter [Janibacter limosus]UUZ45879.1 cation diffusion facilitator family transporter [Janibacter limosus]